MESTTVKPRRPLQAFSDIGGYSTVVVPGKTPSFIIKPASSPPHIIDFKYSAIQSIAEYNVDSSGNGFLFMDDGVSRIMLFH